MDSRLRKMLWFGVSTAIIAGMLYFADLSRVIEAVSKAKVIYLIPAFIFGISVFGIWAYTWHSFFRQMEMDISYSKSFRMFMSGTFFNSITPLGQFGGEPFMAYVISRNTDYSTERAFSAVLSADIVNTVPIFTFVVGGFLFEMFFGSLNDFLLDIIYVVILTTIVGGTLVYLLWFKSGSIENAILTALETVTDFIGFGRSKVSAVEDRLMKVQNAFSEVGNNPRALFKVAVISHLGFFFQVLCLAAVLTSLDFTVDITPLYFAVTLAGLANFSPTPGGSGTYEAAMATVLTLFIQINFASALVAAIIFRATTYWPGILIGYLSLNTLENGG